MATEEIERTGDILIEEGIVTQEDIAQAISGSGMKGTALATALESAGHPKRRELAAFLASDFRVPKLNDLREVDLPADAARILPEDLARKHELVPVGLLGNMLCLAKGSTFNRAAIQEIRRQTGLRIKMLMADEGQVKAALERVYRNPQTEIPAPKAEKKDTVMRRAQPPAVREEAAREAVPLIEGLGEFEPLERARGEPRRPAAKATPSETLAALRVSGPEEAALAAGPAARLLRDWDELFMHGRPVLPFKVG